MDKVGTITGAHLRDDDHGRSSQRHAVRRNQPEGKTLYWADQWRIDPGDDFFELPGAISGFRRYEKAGFDKFIETKTN